MQANRHCGLRAGNRGDFMPNVQQKSRCCILAPAGADLRRKRIEMYRQVASATGAS